MAKVKGHGRKAAFGLVLDNSVAMAWSFEDETSEYAEAVLDSLAELRAYCPSPLAP